MGPRCDDLIEQKNCALFKISPGNAQPKKGKNKVNRGGKRRLGPERRSKCLRKISDVDDGSMEQIATSHRLSETFRMEKKARQLRHGVQGDNAGERDTRSFGSVRRVTTRGENRVKKPDLQSGPKERGKSGKGQKEKVGADVTEKTANSKKKWSRQLLGQGGEKKGKLVAGGGGGRGAIEMPG